METFSESDAIEYFGLQIVMNDQVYGPSDDTDLGIEYLMKYFTRLKTRLTKADAPKSLRILDMGTGSGSLALFAVSRCLRSGITPILVGVDVNPHAVALATYNSQINKLDDYTAFLHGSYFEPLITEELSAPFDLILFNPPYLAGEPDIINETNRTIVDASWEGGPNGNEITLVFLEQIKRFLVPEGEMMFISSSLVNQEPLLDALNAVSITVLEILKHHVFFEDILLYCTKRKK